MSYDSTSLQPNKTLSIVYIGGGAASFFAAINGANQFPDAHHVILEATSRLLTKVKISGGGRCNLTHSCFDPKILVTHYPRGSKELLGPFQSFQPEDTIRWFEKRGIKIRTEGDGRIFPVTNSSETIIQCLLKEAEHGKVEIRKNAFVKAIRKDGKRFEIELAKGGFLEADRIFLGTGSSPIGYKLAKSLGHQIVEPVPSLFTFKIHHPVLTNTMGTSLPNVGLELMIPNVKRKRFRQVGPLLITHWGLSGPAILKLSAFAARELNASQYRAQLHVNWLGTQKMDRTIDQLTAHKSSLSNATLKNSPFPFSRRFWETLLSFASLNPLMHWHETKRDDLLNLSKILTRTQMKVAGKGEFKEEFVTAGGVKLSEIYFKTMESKLCPGLFLGGEILNIDGITGGFNFQNAWTTGWLAAHHIGAKP